MMNPKLYNRKIQVNVTDACNLSCSHCNRCCDSAVSKAHISVSDIDKMCSEVKGVNRVCLAGGEPMLHPHIEEIIQAIRSAGKIARIDLLTNGLVKNEFYWELIDKYKLTPFDTKKDESKMDHVYLMYVAPIDVNLFGLKDPKKCDIARRCGLGYSTMGWYPCCVSAAIGRVFGIEGVQHFGDFSLEKYSDLLDKTCRYCGYYLTSNKNTILPPFAYPSQMKTISWIKALEEYNCRTNK